MGLSDRQEFAEVESCTQYFHFGPLFFRGAFFIWQLIAEPAKPPTMAGTPIKLAPSPRRGRARPVLPVKASLPSAKVADRNGRRGRGRLVLLAFFAALSEQRRSQVGHRSG